MTPAMTKIEQVKVWVAYTDDGYEGCSEPLAAFATKFLADVWLSGAQSANSGRRKIFELPLIDAALQERSGS